MAAGRVELPQWQTFQKINQGTVDRLGAQLDWTKRAQWLQQAVAKGHQPDFTKWTAATVNQLFAALFKKALPQNRVGLTSWYEMNWVATQYLTYLVGENILNVQLTVIKSASEQVEAKLDMKYQRLLEREETESQDNDDVLTEYAENQMLDDEEFNMSQENSPTLEMIKPIVTDVTKMTAIARIYDPDPQRRYLDQPHLSKKGGRQWQQIQAEHVHEQGVRVGLQLWLQRNFYALPAWDASAVVQATTMFYDFFYREHIQVPAHWTMTSWKQVNQWMSDQQNIRQHADTIALLMAMLQMLATQNELTNEQSEQLMAVLQKIPVNSAMVLTASHYSHEHVSKKRLRKARKRRKKH